MSRVIRIGNAQGFWGDSPTAPARLVEQAPDLDVLTLDYLAEVSMSILAKQRERDQSLGYARDFIDVVASLAPAWKSGRKLRLVTNAGGLNPQACGQACAATLKRLGLSSLKIGVVSGDDVLPLWKDGSLKSMDQTPMPHQDQIVTANTYIGAAPVVETLANGADIVITGRVADPSLSVAPCVAHFGWSLDDFDRIAGATIAGHLIECGTQVTGGISADWLALDHSRDIGFPIVEVSDDGSCVVTKPPNTGGRVDEHTVKEQLVYEIGDPANFLTPDATVSMLSIRVEDLGNDRVRVSGARGKAPSEFYKVSATYRAGFRASGMLTIFGRDAVAKARLAGEMVLQRLRDLKMSPKDSLIECLGAGAAAPGTMSEPREAMETVLRISIADERRDVVERFTKEFASLVTCGPQGTTGYAEGRPAVREVFGYWPCLIERSKVQTKVEVISV
jgi:hypothetical protein